MANIKKHGRESILLTILIFLCITLLSSAVSAVKGIKLVMPSMVENSGCYKNFIYINQDKYSDRYLAFLENDPRVEGYDHTSMVTDLLKVRVGQDADTEQLFDISFVPESGERRMESFSAHIDFQSVEHPIVLASPNKEKLEISVGDELTVIRNGKEFSFTVAGFYDCGIWAYGTKAVISEDDFASLENYMARYEVIGINTVSGTDDDALLKDFRAFAQDASIGDLTSAMYLTTYKDMVDMNETNMELLSIIIAILSGVIVIAVMIMIRFRIVSDLKEQILSIGVLEALGYTSGEIAASYVAEYMLLALAGAVIGIVPSYFFAKVQLHSAASSVNYGGAVAVPVIPILCCVIIILLFVGLTAMSRALAVRKYPPVLAFRKGIETHSFKKNLVPLEKTRGSVHVRLAMKEFLQGARNQIGLTVCIAACTVMVLLSFMIGSFFSSADRILGSVCGHEMCDMRIEGTVDIDPEAFVAELESMPEVKKVLTPAVGIGVKINGNDNSVGLEVYEDYAKTSTILLTEGRLPEHDNEVALAVQEKKGIGVEVGDTVTIEYGKVKRDYLVTGCVNSAVDPMTAYLTTEGFKRMNPAYVPHTFDMYLNEGVDKNAFADFLKGRYGKEIAQYKDGEVTGDTLEERIRSAANAKMAKAMTEKGVSYMEYSIQVGDQVITGSTSAMKIRKLTFVKEENQEIASMLCISFAGISIGMMIASGVIVILMLAILMASTIRKQYRELGILKSLGYTSRELMFQMAFRIIPVALIAVVIGTFLSIPLMGIVGAFVCKIEVSVMGILFMDLAILAFCFGCAYTCARRIKKISAYELITE
jgi:ABC-type antimicrobial peptide transport system permease subunit